MKRVEGWQKARAKVFQAEEKAFVKPLDAKRVKREMDTPRSRISATILQDTC